MARMKFLCDAAQGTLGFLHLGNGIVTVGECRVAGLTQYVGITAFRVFIPQVPAFKMSGKVERHPHHPRRNPLYNLKNVKLNAKINTEGTVEGLMITTYNGLNALEYRTVASNQKEEDIIALLESNYRDIEIEKFRISNKEKCSKPLSEMLQFTQDNGADIIGDKIYISPLLFLTVN